MLKRSCPATLAVDTILLKLLKYVDQVPFLRLGKRGQIHPSLLEHSLDQHVCERFESCDELKNHIEGKRVMASTCLGVFHPLLAGRKFDVVIGDEASQMTQPLILGPMRFGNRFILVGDHYQLPPLVKDDLARDAGMDVSMFMRLSAGKLSVLMFITYVSELPYS
jgi:DNA replication ATP-dependent helicase Dna2